MLELENFVYDSYPKGAMQVMIILPCSELKIGNAYIRRNGEKIEHFPADMGELEDITVHIYADAFMILLSLSVLWHY